jgi:hypothetical protein
MKPKVSLINKLLAEIGVAGDADLRELQGGANNRVYRLDRDGSAYLLKSYFRDRQDPRDRLNTEYNFSQFAWTHGVNQIARPLAKDSKEGIGLYEFIEGRQCSPVDVTKSRVEEAGQFFCDLNVYRSEVMARELKPASEACFSVSDHIRCVASRVVRLGGVEIENDLDRAAVQFINDELTPAWELVTAQVRASRIKDSFDQEQVCLSPSDFGFHNALLGRDQRLRFIDFEYAGWDDPAKMICDFFSQPRVPVRAKWAEGFMETAMSDQPWADAVIQRVRVLRPLYRVKWCCIMLNEFLPVGKRRRRFSVSSISLEEAKTQQLKASNEYLQKTFSS